MANAWRAWLVLSTYWAQTQDFLQNKYDWLKE